MFSLPATPPRGTKRRRALAAEHMHLMSRRFFGTCTTLFWPHSHLDLWFPISVIAFGGPVFGSRRLQSLTRLSRSHYSLHPRPRNIDSGCPSSPHRPPSSPHHHNTYSMSSTPTLLPSSATPGGSPSLSRAHFEPPHQDERHYDEDRTAPHQQQQSGKRSIYSRIGSPGEGMWRDVKGVSLPSRAGL